MHFYKKNIGDYHKKAGRLSLLQHGAYTLLMDACYDRERFPTESEAIDWLWASSGDEIDAIKFVLAKFFVLDDGKYIQPRIEREIEDYQAKAKTNQRIAREREEKRRNNRVDSTNRAQDVNAVCESVNEAPPNYELLTINEQLLNNKEISNSCSAKKPNEKKSKFKFNDEQMSFAKHMQDCLKELNPNQKEPNFNQWANDVRMLNEADGRSGQQINDAWEWVRKDSFWSTNILSPLKFRKQFDAITIKMNGNKNPNQQNSNSTVDVLKEIYNEQQPISNQSNGQIISDVSAGRLTIQG